MSPGVLDFPQHFGIGLIEARDQIPDGGIGDVGLLIPAFWNIGHVPDVGQRDIRPRETPFAILILDE